MIFVAGILLGLVFGLIVGVILSNESRSEEIERSPRIITK